MIPGPADRRHFLEEQKRNRKSAWKFSALSTLAVLLMGIPLSLAVTPLLYAVALVLLNLLNLIHRFPPTFWDQLGKGAYLAVDSLGTLLDGGAAQIHWGPTLAGMAALLLPGMAFMGVLFAAVRLILRKAGSNGVLAALGAREPNPEDLEEKQIVNLVDEMAIAAGVQAPRVRILDAPSANAAALGTSPEDAVIVVSRGLLAGFDRDETQGVIAHFIASIGNGDLGIAWTLVEVLNTYGLLTVLMEAPFGPQARGRLRRLFRLAFGSRTDADAGDLMKTLTASFATGGDQDLDELMKDGKGPPSFGKKVKRVVMLPLIFVNLSIRLTLFFFITALLGPCLALLWRSRRYLADAEAVQLTRNPDGLAKALSRVRSVEGLPGGEWASHLFFAGGKGKQSFGELTGTSTFLAFNPPEKRRLKRLEAMGSSIKIQEEKKSMGHRLLVGLFWLALSPLFALLAYLMAMVVAMMVMMNLMIMSVVLVLINWVFHWFH